MSSLAERITRKSSVQTYITIMFLVDKPLMQQCFQAYAYFRWLDDQIDLVSSTKKERLRCIKRQQQLIQESYDNTMQQELIPEEQLIADLIQIMAIPLQVIAMTLELQHTLHICCGTIVRI